MTTVVATFHWRDGHVERKVVPTPLSPTFRIAVPPILDEGQILPKDHKVPLATFDLKGGRYLQVDGPVPDRAVQAREQLLDMRWKR